MFSCIDQSPILNNIEATLNLPNQYLFSCIDPTLQVFFYLLLRRFLDFILAALSRTLMDLVVYIFLFSKIHHYRASLYVHFLLKMF
ncbi:hypothetical protein HanRHA438_Chr00c33g0855421 [Helianthus annuus]|nr:hypothetical protein HanRHA438_Chr00c33g0855421 [Helianthus annuus]